MQREDRRDAPLFVVDLLDLTRLESGQKKRELVAVDVRDVVHRAIETVAADRGDPRVALVVDAPPNRLPSSPTRASSRSSSTTSSRTRSSTTGQEGAWRFAWRGGRSELVLTVADTGIGMSAKEVARLFGEFVRIRNAKTRDIPGSGLGLSIVRKLVELAGGEVTVESEPEVGTTFTVRLPAVAVPAVECTRGAS